MLSLIIRIRAGTQTIPPHAEVVLHDASDASDLTRERRRRKRSRRDWPRLTASADGVLLSPIKHIHADSCHFWGYFIDVPGL